MCYGRVMGGHGVLYERQPFVGASYVYAGGLGRCPVAYALCGLM